MDPPFDRRQPRVLAPLMSRHGVDKRVRPAEGGIDRRFAISTPSKSSPRPVYSDASTWVAEVLLSHDMAVIPQKELRNNVAQVLRRAEAGEELTITVAGRPVARLGPVPKRRWVEGEALKQIWETPPPRKFMEDLERLPGGLADPFE